MRVNIRPEIRVIKDEIIALRRQIHQHPELGFQEFETAKLIAKQLKNYGLEVKTGIAGTGIVGFLKGKSLTPCIGLRADMDALPIQEESDLPFTSKQDGVMHACGHDGHVAMLLGAAKVLSVKRGSLRGCIKFIFQPAEEGGGGARYMIKEGVLENPQVDEIYGIHLWNYQPFGTVGVKEGPVLAAADLFTITVKGKGGHGAAPQGTVDSIVVAAQLVTALQTIVSRNTNPLESAVVSVGKIEGGYNFNVIADKVVLKGTARAYSEANRKMVIKRLNEICEGVAKSFGAKIELDYQDGYPPTVNDPQATEKLSASARKIVNDGVMLPYLSMGGEDMSYYLQKVPGCFFFVGSAPYEKELMNVPHHSSCFHINEQALLVGSSIWVQLIEDLLIEKE